MKKIILILFLFVSCYFIYYFTNDKKIVYVNIGDEIAMGLNSNGVISEGYGIKLKNYLVNKKKDVYYNDSFCDNDLRITDVIRMIKNYEKISINNDEFTINELLKKADLITISLGMNELYYKLLLNKNNIYSYIDSMVEDMKELLEVVSKYSNAKVIVLGYYNVTGNDYDIFSYVNYNINSIVNSMNYIYIDCDKILDIRDNSLIKRGNYYLNNYEYNKIFKIIVDKI